MQTMKLDCYSSSYTKIHLKWTKDLNLNVRPETMQLLEENIREKIPNTVLGIKFLNMTLKAQATNAKRGKWNCIKLRKILHSKGNS